MFLARLSLLGLIASLAMLSDWLVLNHQLVVEKLKDSENFSAYLMADSAHHLHLVDDYALVLILIVSVLCLSRTLAQLGLLQVLWALGLLLILMVTGVTMVFETIADGAQTQFGARLSFMDSLMPSVLMELGIFVSSLALLYMGPYRGWSGDD